MWTTLVRVRFLVQLPSGVPVTQEPTSPYTISMSVVPRLKTSSFNCLGKWIINDDFEQNRCSRNLLFSTIYQKTALRNLPERQEFQTGSLSDFPDDFWS
ncbi:hypothetical protein TNCV_4399181 [Trichonephila clavipes]|nr:hypothetical protein TNCV_4399181 [Trichonephila clavipes]